MSNNKKAKEWVKDYWPFPFLLFAVFLLAYAIALPPRVPWGVDPEKYDPNYNPNAPAGTINEDGTSPEPVRWDSAGTVVSVTMLGDSHLVTVIKTEKMVFFLRKPIGAVRIGAKVEHGWTFRHGDWIRLDDSTITTYRLLPDGMLSPTGRKLR